MAAVVVVALELRSEGVADEAAERLVQRSSWDVVELLGRRSRPATRLPRGEPAYEEDRDGLETWRKGRATASRVQTVAPAAAREEVLVARREPGVDPEAADRVLPASTCGRSCWTDQAGALRRA